MMLTEFMQKQVDRAITREIARRSKTVLEEDDEQNSLRNALLIIVALMIVQGAICLRTANSC